MVYRVRVDGYEFIVPDERLARGIKELWEFSDLFDDLEDLAGLIEMHLCDDEEKYECAEREECSEECDKCWSECERVCSDPDSDECACEERCDEICERTCVEVIEVRPRGKRRARA